jgi:hypothetical protein
MRRLIVTIGAFGLLAGCVVHARTPRYGYYGPRHEWRAEERHERHEAREREHVWRAPEDHD